LLCRAYKGIANHVAKASYRADLNGDAIARASAIRNSQREKKETPEKKLRGAKARKAAVKE
jgi:large subunit ribosomal protein L28e